MVTLWYPCAVFKEQRHLVRQGYSLLTVSLEKTELIVFQYETLFYSASRPDNNVPK